MTTKFATTPFRYPGGKSKMIKKLLPLMPDLNEFNSFYEPFLGGGSVALRVTQMFPHLNVVVTEKFEPLYNCWVQIQQRGEDMMRHILDYKHAFSTEDRARELYSSCQTDIENEFGDPFSRACSFYIANKCSFSGIFTSTFSPQASVSNWSIKNIERLPSVQKAIQSWDILNADYSALLTNDEKTLTFLDPPYDLGKQSVYGGKGDKSTHTTFDHEEFARLCADFQGPQLITYNDSMAHLFPSYEARYLDHTYTMASHGKTYMEDQKKRQELVLTNYEVNV